MVDLGLVKQRLSAALRPVNSAGRAILHFTDKHNLRLTLLLTALSACVAAVALVWDHSESNGSNRRDPSSDLTKALPTAFEDVLPSVKCGAAPGVEQVSTGWGPGRNVYRIDGTDGFSTTPTLNAIHDNPSYGDERTFFDVRSIADDAEDSGYCNSVRAEDGAFLELRAFVENSAADSVDGGATINKRGIAKAVRMMITTDEVASRQTLWAAVSARNTEPGTIRDALEISAKHPFRLDFVKGSGRLWSNFSPEGGSPLRDDIWGGSVWIGPKGGGDMPPGYKHAVWVTLTVRVTFVG